jgi:ubiquinone/menaquinone biosynthesis C-methylase UbiE
MPTPPAETPYVLGETDAEHERLTRQAALFAPFTERLFRDAGIGPGQRVLDIGSGLGDVAMLVADLVGPKGEVVGVERDTPTIAKATQRVARAGLRNVSFLESDVSQVVSSEPFDAVVGRLILEFLPNPGAVVRSLAALVRPGGLVVFQDAFWSPLLQLSAHLPLRSQCVSLIHEAFARSGANMDMELVFYRTLQTAGLPPPSMRIDVPVGDGADLSRWVYDLFFSLLPRMKQHGLPFAGVGDSESLQSRLQDELTRTQSFASCIGLVGAWSRKPR